MTIEFSGEVWYWRGPAPFFFVTVPEKESAEIKEIVSLVTYGWGMVPVIARVGKTEFKTALWPKNGRFILGLKDRVRKSEAIEEGDTIIATMKISQVDLGS